MLSGKGKHGPKRSGKGTGATAMTGGSKVKDPAAAPYANPAAAATASVSGVVKVKHEADEGLDTPPTLLIRTADNLRLLPRYTQVLTRGRDESVMMEELDHLQLELETLLSCAAIRHRSLLQDISQIEALDERHKKSKLGRKPTATPPNVAKRANARPEVGRPPKKAKTDGKPETPSGGKLNRHRGLPTDGDSLSPKPDVFEAPKNDLPDKFWASVEPYCRAITAEDIGYLQQLIRSREDDRNSELHSIPPLGKHYTVRWAEEDGTPAAPASLKPSPLGGTAGPMTQRLVAALVEDRNAPMSVEDDRSRDLSSARAAALAHVKSSTFESRVREELREQGILDGDEAPKAQADDELLLEMKRCQSELKALSNHNLQRLKHLLVLAEAQQQRQQLKKKLQAINAELLKVHAMKIEKKHLSEKEKEATWRLIREMKSILKELYPSLAVKSQ